jgi:uncharacterized protein DUF839
MKQASSQKPKAARFWIGGFAVAIATATAFAQTAQGPSSTESPYLVPLAPGVRFVSILTVGNTPTADPNYRMVGTPDGLGAFRNPRPRLDRDERDGGDDRDDNEAVRSEHEHGWRRTFTLLSNHEFVPAAGRVRDHGATGAFVSKWTIDAQTLEVVDGQDLIQFIRTNPDGQQVWNPEAKGIALNRLCSADLPQLDALFNERTGRGYPGRLFFSGEEVSTEGRAFAHALDGISWELPHLGNMAYENIVLNPAAGDKTIAMVMDDGTGGQVYTYVGTKQRTGNPVQRAGLANGTLYGIRVPTLPQDPDAPLPQEPLRFELAPIADAAQKTGAQIETESNAEGVTHFLRPEDGSWDPRHPRDFYLATTDNYDATKPQGTSAPGGISGYSRLWRIRFDDIRHPEAGGRITPLLDGRSEPVQMLDNLTVSPTTGHILLQEDPGNQTRSARIWLYTIATDTLTLLAKHDPVRFGDSDRPPVAPPATVDEESSGIIPAFDLIGPGWFLLDVQAHTAPRPPYTALQPELVADGQYLAMYVPQTDNRRQHDDGDEREDRR